MKGLIEMSTSPHNPVLLQEVVEWAGVHPGSIVVDATVGFGGHAAALIPHIVPNGSYIGIDKDERAIEATRHKFAKENAANIILGCISDIKMLVQGLGIDKADAVLMDLGVSSPQLDDTSYGISFAGSGPLDMRIGVGKGDIRAHDIINKWSRDELKQLFTAHGQPATNRLVDAIIEMRRKSPIRTIEQLRDVIEQSVPHTDDIHQGTRVFQALRVVVNQEYEELRTGLEQAVDLLKTGGRLLVISFHSGEDKIVKEFMKYEARDCICPPEFPVCQCTHKARVRILSKDIITPDDREVKRNPRSRSARMRVAERI